MNSKPSVTRRFCGIIRFWCSLGRDRQNSTQARPGHCPDCDQYAAAEQRLENALRSEARQQANVRSVGLERSIQAAIASTQTRPQPRRTRAPWALGGLAAATLAAVTIVRIQDQRAASAQNVATVQDVIAVAKTVPRNWLGSLRPKAVQLVETNPLQTELASVQSDAKSALNFLALNFLPSSNGNLHRSGETLSAIPQAG